MVTWDEWLIPCLIISLFGLFLVIQCYTYIEEYFSEEIYIHHKMYLGSVRHAGLYLTLR